MNIMIIGANSYIAKHFSSMAAEKHVLKSFRREKGLESYFDLVLDDFSNIDVVINFTAIVHKKNIDEKLYNEVNFKLVTFLADMAKQKGVKQFIQMSTIAVYGSKKEFIDVQTLEEPDSDYGMSKLQGDQALFAKSDKNFLVAIVRPPIVYGKNAPGNMESLIRLIDRNLPLPFKFYENQRSMIFIDNLVNALLLIIEKRANGIFLLKDNKMPSLGELADKIQEFKSSKSHFFHPPSLMIDFLVQKRISLFHKLFGNLIIEDTVTKNSLNHYCIYDFNEAIKKTIER